ncbi:hypothetical protein HKX48_001546 [Thoreauomyces humboldtii]|nr:hypothetical protein HKX48_001546 [Thoreauomyces humboldtii]
MLAVLIDTGDGGSFRFSKEEVKNRLVKLALCLPDVESIFGTDFNATSMKANNLPSERHANFENIWFQCPWPSPDTLCRDFLGSAAACQTEGDHVFLGVVLDPFSYSSRYDLVKLRTEAKGLNYKFIGIDWETLDLVINFGYKHRTSSANHKQLHQQGVRGRSFAVLVFCKMPAGGDTSTKDNEVAVLSTGTETSGSDMDAATTANKLGKPKHI